MEIRLTKGFKATVDPADYETLSKFKWCSSSGQKTQYAVRGTATGVKYKRKIVLMHHQIMGEKPFIGAEIDPINGNGLDNRRSNLRWCSHKENRRNEPKRQGYSNKFKGAFRRFRSGREYWMAQIKLDGKSKFLGHFKTEIEAAAAYNAAAKEAYGDFASLNVL